MFVQQNSVSIVLKNTHSCLKKLLSSAFGLLWLMLAMQTASTTPKQHVRVQLGDQLDGLDPQDSSSMAQTIVLSDIMEGLFQWSENQKILPAGAASWEISEDRLQWTIHLRQDAKWSNGEPVSAYDYERSWKRLLSPNEPKLTPADISDMLPMVNLSQVLEGQLPADELGIKAIDQWTLQFRLEEVREKEKVFFLLTRPHYFPVHPNYLVETRKGHPKGWLPSKQDSIESIKAALRQAKLAQKQCRDCIKASEICPGCQLKEKDLNTRLAAAETIERNKYVSNGPFYIRTWSRDALVEIVKNPFYYDAKDVRLEGATYYFMKDLDQILNQYERDEIDLARIRSPDRHKVSYMSKRYQDQLVLVPSPTIRWLFCNPEGIGVKDFRVRQALDLLLDREYLIEKTGHKGTQPTYDLDFIGQKAPAGTDKKLQKRKDWMHWKRKKRFREATKLLRSAGYNEKKPLKLQLAYRDADSGFLDGLRNDLWAHPAIELSFLQSDTASLQAVIDNKSYQVMLRVLVFPNWDPDLWLTFFTSGNPYNPIHYANAHYDTLVLQARRENISEAQRQQLWREAEAILLDTHLLLPVNFTSSSWLVKPKIGGFLSNKPNGSTSLKYLYVQDTTA